MRGTIHLVTGADAVAMYPLTRRVHGQSLRTNFGRGLAGADPGEVTAAAIELLSAEPRTKGELADSLAERWPDADRESLGVVRDPPRPVCAGAAARAVQAAGGRAARAAGAVAGPRAGARSVADGAGAALPGGVRTGNGGGHAHLVAHHRPARSVRGAAARAAHVPRHAGPRAVRRARRAAARSGHAGAAAVAAAAGQRDAVARRPLADPRRRWAGRALGWGHCWARS